MSNLTVVAYQTRRIIKYGGFVVLAVVIAYTAITMAVKAYLLAHPPKEQPDTKFGPLPKIVFPEKKYDKKTFSYELPNDEFPKIKELAKVYVIYRPTTNILALDYYTKIAQGMGFVTKPTSIKPDVYEFRNDNGNLSMIVNVLEGNFQISYPYMSDQMLLNPPQMPDKADAINTAQSYLDAASKFPDDLVSGDKKVSYWQINYDSLKAAPSQSEANIIRVDFFREPIDKLRVVGIDTNKASISVLVSGATVEAKKVVEVNYRYVDVDKESFSTYPLKTPQQAFEELQRGDYWPASDVAAKNVTIRKIELAYFEPVTLVNFLQPIYILSDEKGDFTAYVPAISSKWISN